MKTTTHSADYFHGYHQKPMPSLCLFKKEMTELGAAWNQSWRVPNYFPNKYIHFWMRSFHTHQYTYLLKWFQSRHLSSHSIWLQTAEANEQEKQVDAFGGLNSTKLGSENPSNKYPTSSLMNRIMRLPPFTPGGSKRRSNIDKHIRRPALGKD